MGAPNDGGVSRRSFIRGSGAAASASLLKISTPALAALAQAACSRRDEALPVSDFLVLTLREADALDAIAARILPTTDTPGAREAGVIHFFDLALGGPMAEMLAPIRGGLDGFVPETGSFTDLTEAEQDAWIAERDQTPFFAMVRTLTLMGFFAMSSYGGNQDNVGWKLIGFAGHGATNYPFGYYDAEYRGESWSDEGQTGGAAHGH